MGQNMKRSGNHSANSDYSLILTDEDKAKGFCVMTRGGSVMLLKCGKPVAWFSTAISAETMGAMVELARACEETKKSTNKKKE